MMQPAVNTRNPVDDRIAAGAITKELMMSSARTTRFAARAVIRPKLSRPLHLIHSKDVPWCALDTALVHGYESLSTCRIWIQGSLPKLDCLFPFGPVHTCEWHQRI